MNNKEKLVEKTIIIVLGGSNTTEFKTTARTWGELKTEIKNDISLPEPHAATIGETVAGLVANESLLPSSVKVKGKTTNTYHIFVTPKKSKSGQEITVASMIAEFKGIIEKWETALEAQENASLVINTKSEAIEAMELLTDFIKNGTEGVTIETSDVQDEVAFDRKEVSAKDFKKFKKLVE